MDFYSVTQVIADLPELSAALDYDRLITYIDLVRLLKPDLTRFIVSENGPPKHLPVAFHDFLKLSLGLEDETAKLAWATLRLFAWDFDHEADDPRKTSRVRLKYMRLFLEHGSSRGIAFHSIHELAAEYKFCPVGPKFVSGVLRHQRTHMLACGIYYDSN